MSKMTPKQKRELLVELCQVRDAVKTDEQLAQTILQKHLKFMPRKKLYKFRECTERNFKTIEENCIWMSLASSFPDPFDNTINIDPKQNIKEIEAWMYNNYPILCFDLAKAVYESRGFSIPYTHEDFLEYSQTCLDKNGNPIEEKERAFLIARASPEEFAQMDEIFQQLKLLQNRFADIEETAAKSFAEIINQMRTRMRETTLVYCMTERYDNHTLWENYAKNYTGFCIEYSFRSFTDQVFEDYKNLVYMFPMTYRKKKPYFNMVPLLDGAVKQFIYKDDSWQRNSELDADLNMQLFYKNSDYEYEHEWRFSIKAGNANKQRFPFVSAIYAGKSIANTDLNRLLQVAKHLQVTVYRQTVNSAQNGFNYILIEEAEQ